MKISKIMELITDYYKFKVAGEDDVCREIRREVSQEDAVSSLRKELTAKKHLDQYKLIPLFDVLKLIATPEVEALLFELIDHDNKYMRTQVVEAFHGCQIEAAIPTLCHVARHDSCNYVRKVAVIALGDLGNDEVVPTLLEALQDSNSYVRYEAAQVLARFSSRDITYALANAVLHDENEYVRWAAVSTLQGAQDKEVVAQVLIIGALDGNHHIRRAALKALQQMPRIAMATLRKPLLDPDNDRRWADFLVLLRLTEEHTPEMVDWSQHHWN